MKTFFLLYVVLSFSLLAKDRDSLSRSFSSTRDRFSVRYPEKWRLISKGGEEFGIFNFPARKAQRAVVLPPGGAYIAIIVPTKFMSLGDSEPQTLGEWVKLGTRYTEVVRSRRELECVIDGSPRRVVEVVTQCCKIAPFFEAVEWYFSVDKRFFVATAQYWQGDPNAAKLRQLMQEIVQTMKVFPITSGEGAKKK